MNVDAWLSSLEDYRQSIRATPGRLLGACISMMIGAAALALLLCALRGLDEQGRNLIRDFGVNMFAIEHEESFAAGSAGVLQRKHVEMLRAALPGRDISAFRRFDSRLTDEDIAVTIVQTDEELARARGWRMVQGRFIDATDLQQRFRHAVVTASLASRVGARIGSFISIKHKMYEVVGIIAASSGMLPGDQPAGNASSEELAIFLPWTTPSYWTASDPDPSRVDAVFVQCRTAGSEQTIRACRNIFAAPDAFAGKLHWVTPELLLQKITRVQSILRWTAGSVTVLCLIMGGTILMSLMLANIRERVTEIGLRRALGATPWDIACLFVGEACVLTFISAAAASGLAHIVLWLLRPRLPMPIVFDAVTLFAPAIVAVAVGVVFSFFPALAAARISPASALRND